MDISFVAGVAVPYLVKAAEAFSKTAGEMTANKVGELYRAVKSKFKGDLYAEQTLTRAEEHPESGNRKVMLREVLAEKMNDDKDFADLIFQIVDNIKANEEGGKLYSVSTGDISNSNVIMGNNNNIVGRNNHSYI